MSIIRADRTAVTPEVVLSTIDNKLSISGECYPENPLPFFTPIVVALKNHLNAAKPAQFDAHMHLQYVNSASTKGLQSIISVLNDAGVTGTSVTVYWSHDPEDDALEELGADLVEDFPHVELHRIHVAA
jgi:phosphotransferase system HPr-like phosphotransfer protein